ncbi:hypothetical protein ACNF3S_10540 [Neisseria meningitidis]|uniref:hypothetical protein n=1 Tax=Neisseria meningitidis TaxID=487 RepID=UPI003A8084B2
MIESIEKPQESIRKNRNPHRPSFPQKRESKNATQQEFIGKNRNPTAVIPAKAGIQQHNAAGIYRKKQKPPPTVIPAKAGIQQPKNHRNLSAKTETPTASFPRRRESRNATQQEFIGKNRNPTDRHSRKSGNPDPSARKLTG